ncbi:hypothetical protein [Thermonema rossianum]|uniref:hypothetical protein n=1 Tax=Thermonema rossianum TaxID=55505 RepID=UPI0012FC2FCB|nr:hypothetical protein [Thermonema rossianum]
MRTSYGVLIAALLVVFGTCQVKGQENTGKWRVGVHTSLNFGDLLRLNRYGLSMNSGEQPWFKSISPYGTAIIGGMVEYELNENVFLQARGYLRGSSAKLFASDSANFTIQYRGSIYSFSYGMDAFVGRNFSFSGAGSLQLYGGMSLVAHNWRTFENTELSGALKRAALPANYFFTGGIAYRRGYMGIHWEYTYGLNPWLGTIDFRGKQQNLDARLRGWQFILSFSLPLKKK